MANDIEVQSYNLELTAACLLIMAAAVLLGREHPANVELQYTAKSILHPILVLKQEPK